MNHYTPTDNLKDLIEHIYGFIDSKLQFIDYQINSVVKSFEVKDSTTISLAQRREKEEEENKDFIFSIHFETMIKKIESFSKMKSKLLVIRTNLNSQNAVRSFDLLTDNKYLYYSEKILSHILLNQRNEEQEVAWD